MTKEDRAASLADMQNAGCSDRESYHKYLYGILSSSDNQPVVGPVQANNESSNAQPVKRLTKQENEKQQAKETEKEEIIKRMREDYKEYKEYGKIPVKDKQLADEIESKTGYKLVRYSGHTDDSGGILAFFNEKNNKEMLLSPLGSGNNGFDIIFVEDDEWTDSKTVMFSIPLLSDEAITRIAEAANNYDNENPNITSEKMQNIRKYDLYTDIGLDLHHGRISIENAYNSMLELRKKHLNDLSNHTGPLGAPVATPPQPTINGLHMQSWRFAAQQVKALREGRATEEDVRHRLSSKDYEHIREQVIKEGLPVKNEPKAEQADNEKHIAETVQEQKKEVNRLRPWERAKLTEGKPASELTQKEIEDEYHAIRSDLLEMFPDIKQLQYIISYDIMNKIWDYGSDKYGTYEEHNKNKKISFIEVKIEEAKKAAERYNVSVDMDKFREKLTRISELGKAYNEGSRKYFEELHKNEEATKKISQSEFNQKLADDAGLQALRQDIERQREERNSQLSKTTKETLTNIEKLDREKAVRWLDGATESLREAKNARLAEIKNQFEDKGWNRIEIGGVILYKDGDIPDRASPEDIKQIMIYNAQQVADSINNKINHLEYNTELTNSNNENAKQEFHPYGAWTDFNSRLSVQERERLNNEAISLLEETGFMPSGEEKAVLRRYSGFGGISASDERGVLYDYYTSPPVARLVWQLLEKSGKINESAKILEPSCGTGVFFEFAPKDKPLSFTGVELDGRTAQVAKRLHNAGDVDIYNQSFEAFNLSAKAGGFDHVIGNAPFGERGASLASLDMPEEKSLDNYFVSRSIDNLKDGGTMAIIAAPGVLENKTNEEFRVSLNKKAQFIGAVKLPNRSFHHTHTQVMPDILLFRKYPKDIQDRLEFLDNATFKATRFYDGDFATGTYFEKHPRHIAGTVSEGTGQWGNDEIKGDITPESLGQILSSFNAANVISEEIFEQARNSIDLPKNTIKRGEFRLTDEELRQIENKTLRHGVVKIAGYNTYILSKNNSWTPASEDKTLARKITDVLTISHSVHSIQDDMKAEKDVFLIQMKQKQCRTCLIDYLKKYGAYPADDDDLKRFTREHPAVQGIYEAFLPVDDPLLSSENVYRKQTDVIDGHNAAVSALLQLREKMKDATEENTRAFFPGSAETLIPEMLKHDDVFITTEGHFQLREDFISGDAWKKIDALKAAAEKETAGWKKEKLLYGAAELEKAVGWTPIEDADFSPRSSWIPQEIVREWASSKEALGNSQLDCLSKNGEGKWGATFAGAWQEHNDPLVYYLNGQKQRSKYYDTEAFNKEHDDLFKSFISNHETYRQRLESEYNRKFKTHIVAPVKTYPVEIAGWKNAEEGAKTVKPHQWQSVHHLYRNQCGISALGTGFGKTVTSVALMSLLRQEGKAHRVFLQVPNNKVKDWIEEIRDVMPSLKIASIDPEEPGYSSRDKRYAKYQAMARSDADIILMPESSASEIQLTAENDRRVTNKVSMLYKMEKADSTARQQQKAALMGEFKASSGKANVTVCFEDFGCDALFVDEAHRYKNLFSSTLSRETGMNDGRQSQKAMSLYKKSEHIREQNNGKNVYLLTATPLTNSPLEYYNMMQYVAPDELKRMGVATIDGFIREFANIEMGWLYDWGHGQAKQGNILTGFKNLPTLQNLFFSYTDFQNNPEAVGLDKPEAENYPHIIASDKKQTSCVKAISEELDRYKELKAGERQNEFPGQNFLTFYSQMRTASLDLELFDPVKYKGWKNPKLEALAGRAFADCQKTKGGQVVFCDRVFSSDASFNIHDKIKKELVSQGFKEKDIVIVNGFTKSGGNKSDSMIEKEVSKAIADYNSGKYKVIIGSTACIGEGVNLQKNSSAVHHFDIPFRPSDFIQRNGRVDRQGNEQEKVSLHTYLAAGTIDNYSVNLVQRKANWIDKMLRTKSDVFTNPNDENSIDADELLLALTEEWGDKDAAVKRRKTLETQKQEKIKEAQEKQMRGNLKNLSLARGALSQLDGNENSAEYKKRLGQITSLETSLKNNPVFTKHDLLGGHEPFLYDGGSGVIYRKNDVLIIRGGIHLVENFNFKKQELLCAELESDEKRKDRVSRANIYGYGSAAKILKKYFTLAELSGKKRGYSHNEVSYHLEKTAKDERETLKDIGNEKFYKLPADKKEKYYAMHIAVINENYSGDFSPVVFSTAKDGSLEINNGRHCSRDEKLLNPFSAEGKTSILKALGKGVQFPYYDNSDLLTTLGNTVPELKDHIARANDKIEREKQLAKKQENTLEKELLNKSAEKLNAGINHFKSHVHVCRVRV